MPRDDLKGGFNVGHGYEIVNEFSGRCPNSFSGVVVQWKHFRAVARISFAREVLPWKHFRAVARISFVMEVLLASVKAFSCRGPNFFRNGSASVEAMTSPVAHSARLVAWPGFWLARYCPFCGP